MGVDVLLCEMEASIAKGPTFGCCILVDQGPRLLQRATRWALTARMVGAAPEARARLTFVGQTIESIAYRFGHHVHEREELGRTVSCASGCPTHG